MLLPGRFSATSLGDLLGQVHRAQASGVVEIVGTSPPCFVRVLVDRGLVAGVQGPTKAQIARTPHEARELIDAIERKLVGCDGEVRFHVGVAASLLRVPRLAVTLAPSDFLHGRRRARVRRGSGADRRRSFGGSFNHHAVRTPEAASAMALLGVGPTSDMASIRRAFRIAAAQLHPDRFPEASEVERQALAEKLSRLSAAYHLLCA